MNLPTLIVGLIVFGIFFAIVINGIRKWKSGKGGCSCGSDCGACGGGCGRGCGEEK